MIFLHSTLSHLIPFNTSLFAFILFCVCSPSLADVQVGEEKRTYRGSGTLRNVDQDESPEDYEYADFRIRRYDTVTDKDVETMDEKDRELAQALAQVFKKEGQKLIGQNVQKYYAELKERA